MSAAASLPAPLRTASVTRAARRHCVQRGWAPLLEFALPAALRADIMAVKPDGCFAIIEVKSCARDFQADAKWEFYRDWCDELHFAVDLDFPQALIPPEVGLIVCDGFEAHQLREAATHPLAGARRKSLLLRFARAAAGRLAWHEDPEGAQEARAALLLE
ncbi:MAG: MmcB family DNA repair protein [Acetobacteraceae bacterium]|nr:MmcB family DNA repair protein [Acetobacteraceae bacterium]